ncbi:MAG: ribosome small subunit-dependent GTPase A [Oscillospiraceae bacterium]|nr:ribosome small subunit-dependent GTPase A [Oscillospiraceae bacterium]
MVEGIIFKALSGFYYVESAGAIIECRARGKFRLENITPLVGDRVLVKETEQGKGILDSVLPRKNAFVRPPIANIDKLVIIASGAIPVTDPYLIDRMTVVAHKNGCETVICINKIDLDPADRLYDIYSAAGFCTVKTSVKTGEGLDQLQRAIEGCICAFTGNSGVGKSSILNALDPEFDISVGEVSRKLGRGRHTTRHVELFRLKCGAIIADTPGFSAFDTERLAAPSALHTLFPDFEPYIGGCRFLDCAHIQEPGCSILEALKQGSVQKTRMESYARLHKQALQHKEWAHK